MNTHILPLTSLIEPTLKSTSVTVEARPTAPRFSLASRISQRRAREDVSNDLPRDVTRCGTNSPHRNDVHSSSRQRNRGYPRGPVDQQKEGCPFVSPRN